MNAVLTVLRLSNRENNFIFMLWIFTPYLYCIVYPYALYGYMDFDVSRVMALITFMYIEELFPNIVALVIHLVQYAAKKWADSKKERKIQAELKDMMKRRRDTLGDKCVEIEETSPQPVAALSRTVSLSHTYDMLPMDESKGKKKEEETPKEAKKKENAYHLIPLWIYQFTFEYHMEVLIAVMVLIPQLIVLFGLVILDWIADFHSAFMFSSNYLSGIASSITQPSVGNKKLEESVVKKDKVQKPVQITVVG